MPDTRKHRGPHPADEEDFRPEALPNLRTAVQDLSWLLTRGYSQDAALTLVGDHLQLTTRQRKAVMRSSCSDQARDHRQRTSVTTAHLPNESILIDGFNLLTTIEAALAGGVILAGRDGCYRDMTSMHGNYRRVRETEAALRLVGQTLSDLRVGSAHWLLDSPVSNSGRLCHLIRQTATGQGWTWDAELVDDPDKVLARSDAIVCSADSTILDQCARWYNLAREVVRRHLPAARIIELGQSPSP